MGEGTNVSRACTERESSFTGKIEKIQIDLRTLKYAADGSLTLYLGAKSPGGENEANWLPAPPGRFSLILRLYWPEASVLNGTWLPPDVKKTN